ncbi:MAG: isochorismatase family cysteine hydrolase [Bdellovibrionota bacterium]
MIKHKHKAALIITDMLNTFDFPEAKQLQPRAQSAARAILKLKSRLKAKKIPIIYVNDNFGQWQSDWRSVYNACTEEGRLGREIAELLRPSEDDYFVLKPKHSAFYSTNLDVLLDYLGTQTLILTGIAGNICVLFTANDAHMRDYKVVVPKDCIASNTAADDKYTLRQLKEVFKIPTPKSNLVNDGHWKTKPQRK